MKPKNVTRWLVYGFVVAVVMPTASASAQLRSKLPRPGLGNEIEGAVWQYTATRKVKDKEEK